MPPAELAWLDYSQADQRRAREIVAMFSQRESRDELGLGRIRDALSDTLFPGTSVLLTRARYFLFVPWLFREGARRGYSGGRTTRRDDAEPSQVPATVFRTCVSSIDTVDPDYVSPITSQPMSPSTIHTVSALQQTRCRCSIAPPARATSAARSVSGPNCGSPLS